MHICTCMYTEENKEKRKKTREKYFFDVRSSSTKRLAQSWPLVIWESEKSNSAQPSIQPTKPSLQIKTGGFFTEGEWGVFPSNDHCMSILCIQIVYISIIMKPITSKDAFAAFLRLWFKLLLCNVIGLNCLN